MAEKNRDTSWIRIAAQMGLEKHTELEEDLGITQTYNKQNRDKLWDSSAKKRAHKEKVFGEKQTYKDPVTGETLHKSQTAARRKYHAETPDGKTASSAWAKHSTETDHVVPLKELHERTRKNPFLRDSDLEEIANQDLNYREISKSFNASKGAKSDLQIALDPSSDLSLEGRIELVKGKVTAELGVNSEIAIRTAKNAGSIFVEGAQSALAASAIPLVISGSQTLIRVAKGEMSVKEAVEEMGNLGVSIAASGGSMRVASFALSEALKESQIQILRNFAAMNQIGNVLVAGSIIARATGKYLGGEVDASGFFSEIGENGLSLVSGMLASGFVTKLLGTATVTTASLAAPVLAAMIASAACTEIYRYAKKLEEEKKSNREIRNIAVEAYNSIKGQQAEIERLLDQDHKHWVEEMINTFQIIASGIMDCDVSRTNMGLLRLMNSYNREVHLYGEDDSLIDDLLRQRTNDTGFRLLR